jgi:phospholipase/carboxylesterase
MRELTYAERPAVGESDGMLILHHSGGADENELLGLADALDRVHRLHVVLPRAPLALSGRDGYDWYGAREVAHPEPDSFAVGFAELCGFHDEIWERTGIAPARTVLGGFSMGTVMSYATGLGAGRPLAAGILAFSGSVPSVAGWAPELETRVGMPVLISNGRTDQSMPIELAHRARALLDDAGLEVTYIESAGGHAIDEQAIGHGIQWLAGVL